MADLKEGIQLRKGQGIAPFQIARPQSGVLKLSGALKKELGADVKARLLPRKGQTRIATRLGTTAPPGTHKATLVTEEGEYPVVVDVPAREKLRLSPSSVHITGRPGDRVALDFMVKNTGNVALEVPTGGVAGLFASDGLAGAFAAAYGSEAEAPLDIFGDFILGLRRSYLGLMRFRLTPEIKGPLGAGQHCQASGDVVLPDPLNADTQLGEGRAFHAVVVMKQNLRLTVRLTLSHPNHKGDSR
ncbi:hypothetical protein [uncultured Roseobacter sp.]|uniref:COG1470 family protein n=1 Tax=uncultured Roseobacter sp. TaxID=114847 RepID=UPI002633A135|nr:hypothetical protein [uncultured Roseobacter sp.]